MSLHMIWNPAAGVPECQITHSTLLYWHSFAANLFGLGDVGCLHYVPAGYHVALKLWYHVSLPAKVFPRNTWPSVSYHCKFSSGTDMQCFLYMSVGRYGTQWEYNFWYSRYRTVECTVLTLILNLNDGEQAAWCLSSCTVSLSQS
jgi:hypothetical protein